MGKLIDVNEIGQRLRFSPAPFSLIRFMNCQSSVRVHFFTAFLVVSLCAFSPAGEVVESLTFEGYDAEGYGRHIVFVSGDEEYRSEEALPMLAKIMAVHHGFKCTVLFAQDPERPGIINPQVLDNIPGLEALRTADLMVIATRFRALPDDQMKEIDDYLMSGRPVVGLRTANHGFRFSEDSKWHHYSWGYKGGKRAWAEGFGGLVLGSWFFSHHGWHKYESTRGIVEQGAERHEILRGIEPESVWGPTDVYGVKEPIPGADVEVLLRGQVLEGMERGDEPLGRGPYEKAPDYVKNGSNDKNDPMQALAWTKSYQLPAGRKGRAFCTTMGASKDLIAEGTRRLVVNAMFWCLDMDIPAKSEISFVDPYQPTDFATHKREYWEKVQLKVSDFDLKAGLYESPEQVQGAVDLPYFDVRGGREGHGYEFADHPVNRQRLYNFYERQAQYYLEAGKQPVLLPHYPDLDGGTYGHWGAFHKNAYRDRRWNLMDVGPVMGGVFRVDGETYPRAIAVKLSDEMSCAFDPVTLRFTHVWNGGFLKFQANRWGIGQGIAPDGDVIARSLPGVGWSNPGIEAAGTIKRHYSPGEAEFHGYHRLDGRVVFHFTVAGTEIWESPTVVDGEFVREVEFSETQEKWKGASIGGIIMDVNLAMKEATAEGGSACYANKAITLAGTVGERIAGSPFAIDRIPVPHHNEFGSMMLIGGHDFFSNGDAAVCTMMGDVWRVSGLDDRLHKVTWTRIATGISQALGLAVFDDTIYVTGRDRIWRLHDLNGDLEIDFYENFCDDFEVSDGGHDFSVDLKRDGSGYFYFVSGKTGMMRIAPDGSRAESIAGGLRNTNGVGASPDGSIVTTSTNEGDWTPASAVFEISEGDFYGRKARLDGEPIAPAMCYLPRGLDNSSGGQVFANSENWGALKDHLFHVSFGNGTWMMILRDAVEGQRTQGAAVPLPGDFESGTHRAAFNEADGHLYVSGADGWGNYSISDGDFARIRYLGDEHLHLPVAWKAYANGIVVEFAQAIDSASATPERTFCQTWNYLYSEAYGSLEYSVNQPELPGHDPVTVKSVSVIDERRVFFEMPDIQPAMQAHLHARLRSSDGQEFVLDMYPTLLRLADNFPGFDQGEPAKATQLTLPTRWPVPFKPKHDTGRKRGRLIRLEAIPGLLFDQKKIIVKRGERISLDFKNTDTIPHNWVLCAPGSGERVGMASNELLANPEAAAMHYVPDSEEVLHYTPMRYHNHRYLLHFNAPEKVGRYPYLCTFPGHWAVMRGELVVE